MTMLTEVAVALAGVAFVIWFAIRADRGVGWQNRIVQRLYYSFGSLENFQRSGTRYASLEAIVAAHPSSRLGRLVERMAPSQTGWFSARFPTDKGGYHDYLARYDELFAPFRDTHGLRVLEIGVKKGGSLALWREYFDESAMIWGIDVNPDVPRFSRDAHIKVLVLDSREASAVRAALGSLMFDIIVDDGAHEPEDQRRTFLALRQHLAPRGLYVMEDVLAIDEAEYRAAGMDVTRFPDPSGQELVVFRRTSTAAAGTAAVQSASVQV